MTVELNFKLTINHCKRNQRCMVKPCNVLMRKGEQRLVIWQGWNGMLSRDKGDKGSCLPCARNQVLNFRLLGMSVDDALEEIDRLLDKHSDVYVGREIKK